MKKLTKEFNAIAVAKGELFTLELPSNPSSGYQWQVAVTAGKASLQSEDLLTPKPPAAGGGMGMYIGASTAKYVFKAEAAGEIEISAEYRQPWSKAPVTPVKFKISAS